MILIYLLAAYLAIGVVAGAAATRDGRGPHPVVPGPFLLWPYVVARWLKTRGRS
jgi:hypothetical protein